MDDIPRERPILLFDGVCNLCNGFIQFVIERDPDGQFRFAPLQSEVGQALLEAFGMPTDEFHTFVLVDGEDCYTRSEAALRVLGGLERPWSWLGPFRYVPRPLRDAVYDFVSSRRYAMFGKREQCMVPTPEIRDRFLGTDPMPDRSD